MGRKKDEEKHALIAKLGVSPNKNWSKSELLELAKKQEEKEAKQAAQNAQTTLIAGPPPNVPAAELPIPFDLKEQVDPFSGLTERQKNIARLRMRGLTQKAIGNIVGLAQPVISIELQKIKEWQIQRGGTVDQDAVVGGTISTYEEIEQAAWFLYSQTEDASDKLKALQTVAMAREKHTRLLMDLGKIKKAGTKVEVTHQLSPFLESWKPQDKKELADAVVESRLKALPEPSPEDVLDAEFIEDEAPATKSENKPSDLEEPTPDDSEFELE